MKSDREFLDGMWEIIVQTEYEEAEIKAAQLRHRKIMKKTLLFWLAAAVLFAAVFGAVCIGGAEIFVLYIIAAISLVFAYWIEGRISNGSDTKGISYHEN